MPLNMNKNINELSPNAVEFFRIFLGSEGKFTKPKAIGTYRPYDLAIDDFDEWDASVWKESTSSTLKLVVMDFHHVPGVINKDFSKSGELYFESFLAGLKELKDFEIITPEVWLWICRESNIELDLRQYIRTLYYGESYILHFANYIPSMFERIGDLPERMAKAKELVKLIFLIKKGLKLSKKGLPKRFEASIDGRYSRSKASNDKDLRLSLQYRIANGLLSLGIGLVCIAQ